jgi:hypothetical protein
MTQDEKLAALQRWHDAIAASDAHLDALDNLVGLAPEGGTQTVVQKLQDVATHATADLVGDTDEWLQWYRFENAMGASGHIASPRRGESKPIITLADLLWVIEGTETEPT